MTSSPSSNLISPPVEQPTAANEPRGIDGDIVSPTQVEAPTQPEPQTRTTRQAWGRGVVLLLVGAAGSFAVNAWYFSAARRAEHTAPVHRDGTQLGIETKRQLSEYDTELVLKSSDGLVRRVLAKRSVATAFVDESIAYLDRERTAIAADIEHDVAALIEQAFADREASIARFADWHFGWGQSWRLTMQAATAAIEQIPKAAFSAESMSEAVRHSLEAYLHRHYRDYVLKPELRDPVIVRGVETILRNAHRRYVATVATLDARLQRFLAEKTTHLDGQRSTSITSMKLDWDAAKWAVPRYALEDEATRSLFRGTQAVTVTALLANTVAPAIERELLVIFAAAGARLTAAVLPNLSRMRRPANTGGRWQGWLTAAALAIGIDWLSNSLKDRWERPDFIKANRDAVETTMATWRTALAKRLTDTLDIWIDDTRGVVAAKTIGRASNR